MTRDAVPQDGMVEVNRLRLHYFDCGKADAPSMFLLHGTSSHAHLWNFLGEKYA